MEIPCTTAWSDIRNEDKSQVLCEEKGYDFLYEDKFQIKDDNKADECYYNFTNDTFWHSRAVLFTGQIFSEKEFASLKLEEAGPLLLHPAVGFAETPKAPETLSKTMRRPLTEPQPVNFTGPPSQPGQLCNKFT